jgi:hypothetical protein
MQQAAAAALVAPAKSMTIAVSVSVLCVTKNHVRAVENNTGF